jgi:hypothetical protein
MRPSPQSCVRVLRMGTPRSRRVCNASSMLATPNPTTGPVRNSGWSIELPRREASTALPSGRAQWIRSDSSSTMRNFIVSLKNLAVALKLDVELPIQLRLVILIVPAAGVGGGRWG